MTLRRSLSCLLLLAAPAAFAGTIAYDYPTVDIPGNSPNVGNQGYGFGLGMDFHVNVGQAIVVDQLGAFYSGQSIIDPGTTLTVQLFDQANTATRLATAVFDSTTPGTLVGGQYMLNITPLLLGAGGYTIVAYGYNNNQLNGNLNVDLLTFKPANLNGGGVLTFDASSPYGSNVGTYPNSPFAGYTNEFGAGTFSFDNASAPEPGSLLLFGTGLVAVVVRRRRRA